MVNTQKTGNERKLEIRQGNKGEKKKTTKIKIKNKKCESK